LSEHYGGPQLLYALLIGLSLHFLSQQADNLLGINFCARTVLRFGVALLGIRITLDQVSHLGARVGLVLVLAVAVTIASGVLLARACRRPVSEGLLSGGAVGICGASAAMAISSVLPPTRENERFTLMAVVGVTVLSTLAMVAYPLFLYGLSVSPVQSGIFLGGTIHDVAQVVAAGMMMGQESGDAASIGTGLFDGLYGAGHAGEYGLGTHGGHGDGQQCFTLVLGHRDCCRWRQNQSW
jgi:uncharacterized membrane protein YadS